jgi:hypothetical protein
VLSDPSSPQGLAPVKVQSFTENVAECDIFQTESRIEIIPNNNNVHKHLNQKLNSNINTQQINKFYEFISPIETLPSSTTQRENLSIISQRERLPSATSQRERLPSATSQRERLPSATSQREQSFSSTLQNEQFSSSYSGNISSSKSI